METILTVVVDNTSFNGIPGEWGLCILAEYLGKKILLDSGSSNLFLDNMRALGIDVKDIDYAVLSHAHYDHANGFPAFFKYNDRAKLYIRDNTSNDCYAKKFIFHKYIGIPKKMLEEYSGRIEKVSGDYKIMEGAYLIPHRTEGLDAIGKRELMFRRSGRRLVADDFSHEQSLVLDTDKGLVILNSCSHGGVINIINEVGRSFPDKKIYGIVGGFHLFNKPENEVRQLAGRIRETGIELVCTGHCTKQRAFEILKEELGDAAQQMRVGYQINLSITE